MPSIFDQGIGYLPYLIRLLVTSKLGCFPLFSVFILPFKIRKLSKAHVNVSSINKLFILNKDRGIIFGPQARESNCRRGARLIRMLFDTGQLVRVSVVNLPIEDFVSNLQLPSVVGRRLNTPEDVPRLTSFHPNLTKGLTRFIKNPFSSLVVLYIDFHLSPPIPCHRDRTHS